MSENEITNETVVTLKLKNPLVLKDKTISELTLREPTAGELSLAEQGGTKKGGNEQMILLIGFAAGLHPNIVRSIKGGDFNRAATVIGDFFEDGQTTTQTSSQS